MASPSARSGHSCGPSIALLTRRVDRVRIHFFGVPPELPMSSEVTGRLYLCARCRMQVFICRRCDRGNRYCRDCAAVARRNNVREAGRRYQQTRRGRFAHAARARRYRARRQLVTHHGSPDPHADGVLQPDHDAAAGAAVALANAAVRAAAPHQLRCHCCGRDLPPLVRTGFVRRRGPHHVRPEGVALGRRSDCGDSDDDSG